MGPSVSKKYPFDIAISFAGEDRTVALQLFDHLKAKNIDVFYDFNEQANLWGKDLIEHLSDVYSNKARYCLMLVSKYYPDKPWTRLESRSALSRRFDSQKNIFCRYGWMIRKFLDSHHLLDIWIYAINLSR